jgi:hypothetical protein
VAQCFVAQPFDGGEFDKRYNQVYKAAIEAAGLDPYRVDCDPSVSIPIEAITTQIKSSSAFFVDITTDNPNVWFELGLAIAHLQDPCIVCAEARTKFPFDVQHRSIIRYKTEAPADFDDLRDRITNRLKAIVKNQTTVEVVEERLVQKVNFGAGLSDVEVLAMTTIASQTKYRGGCVFDDVIYNDMEKIGYSQMGTSVGFRRLSRRNFIELSQLSNGYRGINLTEAGWEWVDENLDRLVSSKAQRQQEESSDFGAPSDFGASAPTAPGDTLDDELPF